MPDHVDVDQDVPLPTGGGGRPACPHCNCSLSDVKRHERLVEDIVPSKVIVTCYHTASGYCPMCRRRVESRAPEQPPAANVPHGQLGLNALATAAVLRVVHRLPFGQVVRVLADLPGLSVSAGGVARQLQRLGGWLDPYYERVKLALRTAPHVNGDETGWRTNGRNGYLWTITDPGHTLYHVDQTPLREGDREAAGPHLPRHAHQRLLQRLRPARLPEAALPGPPAARAAGDGREAAGVRARACSAARRCGWSRTCWR